MPYTKKTIAEVKDTFDKEYEEHKHERPTKICGPNLGPQKQWVGLTPTQVKLLREGVENESIKTGDSIDWVFYTHINEAIKEKNT